MTAPIEIPVRLTGDDTGVAAAIKELAAQLRAVAGPTARAKQVFDSLAVSSERTARSTDALAKSMQGLGSVDVGPTAARWQAFAGNVRTAGTELDRLAAKSHAAVGGMAKDLQTFRGRTGDTLLTGAGAQFLGNADRIRTLPKDLGATGLAFNALSRNLDGTVLASRKVVTATTAARVSVSELGRAMQALGGFLIARRLVAFAGSTLDAAEEIGNLAEKTGLATETLSALAFAGRSANVEISGLDAAFAAFSKQLVGVAQGSKESLKNFRLVGLEAKELAGLSVDAALARTIDAFNALPAGPQKAAAAMALFGRSGKDLIPLLNELQGRGGLAGVTDEARRAGLLLDTETVAAVKRFRHESALLKASVQAVAFELTRSLLPALTGLARGLRDALASSPQLREGLGALGVSVATFAALGSVVTAAAVAFKFLGITSLAALGALAGHPVVLAIAAVSALAGAITLTRREAGLAADAYRKYLTTIGDTRALDNQADALKIRREQLLANIRAEEEAQRRSGGPADAFDRRFAPTRALSGDRVRTFRKDLAFVEQQLRDIDTRQQALGQGAPFDLDLDPSDAAEKRRAFRDADLAAQREQIRLEELQLKASLDRRLVTLEQYFAAREALVQRLAALELASMERELAQAEPEDRDAVRGEIMARRVQLERELLELRMEQSREARAAELTAAREQIRLEEVQLKDSLDRRLISLEQYFAAREELVQRLGALELASETQLERELLELRIERRREEREAGEERLRAAIDEVQAVQTALAQQRQRVQNLVVTGGLTARQGEFAIAALERERLPVLTALVEKAEALAQALGPDAVRQVAGFRIEIENIAANIDLAAREMARLKSSLQSDVEGGIADLFRDPTKPLLALERMLQSIIGTLSDFFARKITDQLFNAAGGAAQMASAGATLAPVAATMSAAGTTLLSASPALSTSAAALTGSGQILFGAAAALQAAAASLAAAQAAGGVTGGVNFAAIGGQLLAAGFARGGIVPGGFGLRDTVPAMLRPGEHVLTPEEVRAAGGHAAILAWRRALLAGLPQPRPILRRGVPHFAAGGAVPAFSGAAAASGGGEFTLRGVFGLEDGLVLRALESPQGERVFVKLARRNRKALGALMPRRAP